jgi:cystathionine beta-synthase
VDYDLIDEGCKVSDKQAFGTARVLARKTGLLIGGSAGGVVYEALKRLPQIPPESTLVALVCDGGEKYLDTVFNDEWMRDHRLLDPSVEQEAARLLATYRDAEADDYYTQHTA